MGKPSPQPGNSIRHFSHQHLLHLSALGPQDRSSSCAACKLKLVGSPTYTCKPCSFHLHARCSEMPQKMKHPFDKIHLLTLLPTPKYEEGHFRCDACGKDGDGFSYHCAECGIDLHTLCANMPSRISHQSHPPHDLCLTFFVPGNSGSFRCDICHDMGSNSWFYWCKECDFASHLMCAKKQGGQTSGTNTNPTGSSSAGSSSNVPNNLSPDPTQAGLDMLRSSGLIGYNPNQVALGLEMLRAYGLLCPNPNQVAQGLDILKANGLLGPNPGQVGQGLGILNGYGLVGPNPGFMPASPMGGLNPLTQPFDPSAFGGIDPSAFAGFDPSAAAGFDPSSLAGMFSGFGFF